MQDETNKIISLAEASNITGYTQDYLGFLCRTGKLEGQKIGRNWTTTRSALEQMRFDAELTSGPSQVQEHSSLGGTKIPVKVLQPSDLYEGEHHGQILNPLPSTQYSTAVIPSAVEESVSSLIRTNERDTSVLVETTEESSPTTFEKTFVVGLPIALNTIEKNDSILNQKQDNVFNNLNLRNNQEKFRGQHVFTTFAIILSVLAGIFLLKPSLLQNLINNDKQTSVVTFIPTQAEKNKSDSDSNKEGQVLAALSVTEARVTPAVLTQFELEKLIMETLATAESLGFFQGPQGPAGTNGTSGTSPSGPIYIQPYIPSVPTSSNPGGTLAGFTDLSSQRFITEDAIINNVLTVNGTASFAGDVEVTGTITAGGITGTINPGLTEGSVIFQGPAGLAQDNANFFWNNTTNRLGIGTLSPAATIHSLATTEQLRLGYDASNYTSFTTSASGDLTVAPSGGDLDLTGDINIGNTGTTNALTINRTFTDLAVGSNYVSSSVAILNPTDNKATSDVYLENNYIEVASGNTRNIDDIYLDYDQFYHLGTGNIDTVQGRLLYSESSSTGQIGSHWGDYIEIHDGYSMYGSDINVYKEPGNASSGEIIGSNIFVTNNSNAAITDTTYGQKIYVDRANFSSAGTYSTYGQYIEVGGCAANCTGTDSAYGLYIASVPAAETAYSIYSAATAQSYFAGNIGIGDTTPDYTLELHNATTTPTFVLSDDDIAHGVTTVAETDSFMRLSSISTTVGGAYLQGIADATGVALQLRGIQSSDPTDTTPAISLIAAKASGTGVVDLAAAETVFQVANNDDTAAMTILGNGNVGIGTVNPSEKLEVAGNISTVPAMSRYLKASGFISNYLGLDTDFGPSDAGFYALSGGDLQFITGGNINAIRIKGTSGNVGIGDISPAAALTVGLDTTAGVANGAGDVYVQNDLEVDGTLTVAGATTYSGALSVITNTSPQLTVGYDSSNKFTTAVAVDGGTTWAMLGTDADLNIDFSGAGADGDFSINTDDLFVDTSTGRVGIGTATPAATEPYSYLTLEGSDATAFSASVINTGAGQAALTLNRTGTTPSRWSMFLPAGGTDLVFYNASATNSGNPFSISAAGNFGMGVNSSSTNRVYIKSNTSDSTTAGLNVVNSSDSSLLYVRSDGNVGIGTASPRSKLEAYGDLRYGGSSPISGVTLSDNPLTIGATTVNVSSTTGFPTTGTLIIDSESMTYTGISGNAFTGVTRGVLGTSAASHTSGARIDYYLSIAQRDDTTPKFTLTSAGRAAFGRATAATSYSGGLYPTVEIGALDNTFPQAVSGSAFLSLNSGAGAIPGLVFARDSVQQWTILDRHDDPGRLSFMNATGGQIFNFLQNGSFGINDTSPDANLEVVNDSIGDSFLVADGGDGDTTPFVIQSNGDVGIGNANPAQKLHVGDGNNPAFASEGLIRVGASNGAGQYREWDFGTNTSVSPYSFIIKQSAASTASLFIDYAYDRTGIGPGASVSNAKLSVLNAETAIGASMSTILSSNAGSTFNTTAGAYTSYGGNFTSTSTRSAGANALTNVGLYASASGAQNNYAALFDNGNVGIGETSPAAALTVGLDTTAGVANGAGDVYVQNDLEVDGTLTVAGATTYSGALSVITNTSPQLTVGYDSSNKFTTAVAVDGGTTWAMLGTDADLNVDFSGAGADGDFSINTDDLFVDTSTGYVGIGTVNPGAKLEVAGDIKLSSSVSESNLGVGIQNSGSYVFFWYDKPILFKSGSTGSGGDRFQINTDGSLQLRASDGNKILFAGSSAASRIDHESGYGIAYISGTTDTPGYQRFLNGSTEVMRITGSIVGIGDTTPDALFDIDSTATTTNVAGILSSTLTTGELMDLTATYAPTDGSDNEALDINLTYTPTTSAGTFRGIDLNVTEGANALANTDYALKVTLDNSANTSTGTHAVYGGHFTAAGKTAGTTTAVGLYATASGADNNYAAIFDSGYVGIGTATPATKLNIVGGDVRIDEVSQSSYQASNALVFRSWQNGTPLTWTMRQQAPDAGTQYFEMKNFAGTPMMVMDSSGVLTASSIIGAGLSGSSRATDFIHLSYTAGLGSLYTGNHSADIQIGNNWMRFNHTTGNVGIGSDTTPVAGLTVGADTTAGVASGAGDGYFQNDLEVDGTLTVAGATTYSGTLSIITTTSPQLTVGYDADNKFTTAVAVDGGTTWAMLGTDADLNVDFSGAGADGDFSINTDDLFVDTSTGYVGIGTNNLSSIESTYNRLIVQGSDAAAVGQTIINTGIGQVAFGLTRTGGTASRWLTYLPTGSTDLRLWNAADLVTFQADGEVGIGTASPTALLDVNNTTTSAITAGANARVLNLQGAFTEAGSGTHSRIAGMEITPPTITAGDALVTNTASLYISDAPTATVTATGANYALWVDAGNSRFDGALQLNGGAFPSAGEGMELIASNDIGYIQVYNRDISSWGDLQINAEDLAVTTNGGFTSFHGANVGIADFSPDAALEVVNDGSGDSFLVADSADGDTTPFVIQADGDVGIGTTAPLSGKLDIRGPLGTASWKTSPTDGTGGYNFGFAFVQDTSTFDGTIGYFRMVDTDGTLVSGRNIIGLQFASGGDHLLVQGNNGLVDISASNKFRFCGGSGTCATASELQANKIRLSPSFGTADGLTDPGDGGVHFPGNSYFATSTGSVGIGTASPDGKLEIAGNVSAAAWGLNGIQLQGTAATFTDSSTAAAGTATNAVISSLGQSTLASTNAITTTNAYGLYLAGAPISGANQTLTNTSALYIGAAATTDGAGVTPTNSYGLNVNAQTGAINNYAAQFDGGNVNIRSGKSLVLYRTDNAISGSIYEDDTNAINISSNTGISLTGDYFQYNGQFRHNSAYFYNTTGSGLTIRGATLDAGTALTIDTDTTLTTGKLLDIKTGTVSRLLVNGNGTLRLDSTGSAAAWGLNGIQLQGTAATYTDSSTAASGTATNAVFTSFGQPTLAATNATVTTTNASTVYIANAPAAGTNQTITNAYALWVGAGTSRFDGYITAPGAGGLPDQSERFGYGAAAGLDGTSLGFNANAGGAGVSIGKNSVSATSSTAVGQGASANNFVSTAIGSAASANSGYDIALGYGATTTAASQFVAGSNTAPITNVYIGNGVTNTAPSGFVLQGSGGSGTDIAGASVTIAGGKATGNAAGGDILFQTSDASASGATLQSLTTKMTLTELGNLGIGTTDPAGKLNVSVAPTATANYGLVSLGVGPWDGSTSGYFTGSGSGTVLAINTPSFDGTNLRIQEAGVDILLVQGTTAGAATMVLGSGFAGPVIHAMSSDAWGMAYKQTGIGTFSVGQTGASNSSVLYYDGANQWTFLAPTDNASYTKVLTINAKTTLTTAGAKLLSLQNNGSENAFVDKDGGGYFAGSTGIGTTGADAKLELAGNMTQAAWGFNGIQLQGTAATYTDSSTAASGTATNAVFNSFGQPTLAATNATVTTTNAANVYIAAAPAAGTNQTITNAYALWVDSGTSRFDGDVNVGSEIVMDTAGRIYAGTAVSQGYHLSLDAGFVVTPRSGTPSAVGMVVQGLASQGGDLTQWRNSSATVLATVNPRGEFQIKSPEIIGTATFELTGDIDPAASTTVTGSGTFFSNEIQVGDRITVSGETRTVTAIASQTSLTVDTAFSDNANDTTPDRLPVELSVLDSSGNIDFIVQDNGNVGIGVATPGYKFDVQTNTASTYSAYFFNDGNDANRYGIQIQGGADDASGTTYYLRALDGDGGEVGYIANTSGTFALTDSSDVRTKTNITNTIEEGLATIMQLRVVDFNRLADPDGPRITGFIAQEVNEVYPKIVNESPNGYLGISKENLIPILVKAMQEQQAELQSVKSLAQSLQGLGNGILQVDSLVVNSHVAFNEDTVGQAKILGTDSKVRISFTKEYEYQPVVTVTPMEFATIPYRVTEVDVTGFTIEFASVIGYDVTFNWHSFGSKEGKLTISDGTKQDIAIIVPQAPNPNVAQIQENNLAVDGSTGDQPPTENNIIDGTGVPQILEVPNGNSSNDGSGNGNPNTGLPTIEEIISDAPADPQPGA